MSDIIKLHPEPSVIIGEKADRSKPDSAVVFDIQRFSIHDGPGIRTTIFFKGCPLRCAWCQNPESHKKTPEMSFYMEECRRCFRCGDACPNDAIVDSPHRRIDFARCGACGSCAEQCEYRCLRLIGKESGVDPLLTEVLRDRDFFVQSGGGVTLSGGEPALYSDFLELFLPLLKNAGIHTNIETCGYFNLDKFRRIVPFLDMIYFDLKHMDGGPHRKMTGADNDLILANFAGLSEEFEVLIPRMPVIPGFNDSDENIKAMSEFILKRGRKRIHCLSYHKLGESKIARISTSQRPRKIQPPSESAMLMVVEKFKNHGVEAVYYE